MGIRKTGIALVFLGMVATASAQTTVTSGIFGFTKVDKPAGMATITGINFSTAGTSPSNAILSELIGTDYTASGFPGTADRVYVFNGSGYDTYALIDAGFWGGSGNEWRPAATFTVPYGDIVLPVGGSFWIQSVSGSSKTNAVLAGDVISDAAVTNSVSANLQMMANPFSNTVDLNSLSFKNQGTANGFPGSADQVLVFTPDSGYTTYALIDAGFWGGSGNEWRPAAAFTVPAPAINIPIGSGFWYDAQVAFTYVETNSYINNL